MKLIHELLDGLPDGKVMEVRIGLHWTAVVAEQGGARRCGLAATVVRHNRHHGEPDIPLAGQFETLSGCELAKMALNQDPSLACIGVAALNALLPRSPELWVEANAEEVIAQHGVNKRAVLVGHFPFVERLRERVGELLVLELDPEPGDLRAEEAPQVIPNAEVVAITGMTLVNHTLEGLLSLCAPQAFVGVLGPSTPLSPRLFDYGIDWLSGAVVTDIDSVLSTVSQGGNFRQVHRAGVRLVNMFVKEMEKLN